MRFTDEDLLRWFLKQVSTRLEFFNSCFLDGKQVSSDNGCLRMLIYETNVFVRLSKLVREEYHIVEDEGDTFFRFTASFKYGSIEVYTYASEEEELKNE